MESFLYSQGMYPHLCHPIQKKSSHEEGKEHKSTTMES